MQMALYGELAPYYRLLDPTEDHEDEMAAYQQYLRDAIVGERQTLLEIGAGAGNNACYLKHAYRCTLSDISEPMLALSGALNPECEHVLGDMRDLRLQRTFDAVVLHDAVVYMLSEDQLRAAAETAFVHTRPGGAAIVAPDCVRETFEEGSELHRRDEGERAMRCLEWMWDPDPSDTRYTVEYAFMIREGDQMKVLHDRHVEGLFTRATWLRILSEVGFAVTAAVRPIGTEEGGEQTAAYTEEVFLCRRPAA